MESILKIESVIISCFYQNQKYLEDYIAKTIVGEITTIKEGEVEGVVGLPRHGEAHVQAFLDLPHLVWDH